MSTPTYDPHIRLQRAARKIIALRQAQSNSYGTVRTLSTKEADPSFGNMVRTTADAIESFCTGYQRGDRPVDPNTFAQTFYKRLLPQFKASMPTAFRRYMEQAAHSSNPLSDLKIAAESLRKFLVGKLTMH